MKTLYKITKTHYRQDFDYRTNAAHGEHKIVKRKVEYTASKAAVTMSYRYAQQQNECAARLNAKRPGSNPDKYTVDVEMTDLPVNFRLAGWCDEHGVQPWLTVPGLTGDDPVCVECI